MGIGGFCMALARLEPSVGFTLPPLFTAPRGYLQVMSHDTLLALVLGSI